MDSASAASLVVSAVEHDAVFEHAKRRNALIAPVDANGQVDVDALSALLAHSTMAFGALKIAGVAYLLWLAVDALRRGARFTISAAPGEPQPLGHAFLSGVGINLLNPKIILFFLTFLTQFVSVSDPHAGAKLMFLGLYYIALGIPICIVLILAAERFTDALRRSPRAMRASDYLFAGLMGAFAVRLLFARAD